MNVLSLFDGISCGRMALDRQGFKDIKYFASEIDEAAVKGAKALFPDTTHLGSVLDVKASDLPPIDLLIGGSPCQSFSRSGDGSGFDGSSKLFWEYVRLLREIQEYNPNVKFLLENVVMKKEWEQIITDARETSRKHFETKMKELDKEIAGAGKKLEKQISVFSRKMKEIFING